MKKGILIMMVCLFWGFSGKAQTGWVTQKIDSTFSAKFPVTPTLGKGIYVARSTDSVGFSINMVDFNVIAGLDSAALTPVKDTQEFARQLEQGIKGSVANTELGEIKIGKVKGFTTYFLEGVNTKTNQKMYLQMVLIGSVLYNMTCAMPLNSQTGGKKKDFFFASLLIGK